MASLPHFRAPFILQVTGDYLSTNLVADPFYVDWNEDGMSDIIVDWAHVPEGKGRIYHYHWLTPKPVPISYLPVEMEASTAPQYSGSNLTVGLIANPFWGDWDGDGTNDLIVGQLLEGRVRFYRNQGTNTDPVFTTFTFLVADGAEITAPYS